MRLRVLLTLAVCVLLFGFGAASVSAWTITTTADLHGSITPSGAITVNDGADQTFTITPDAGYMIRVLSVDGVATAAVKSYTFRNVKADHTIGVTFQVAFKCYSTTDTCYVCYDTSTTPDQLKELDLGVCDTVRIGCPVCANFVDYAIGDSFFVPIYLYSTNAIGAFSLGFRHTGRGLQFGNDEENAGWDPTGGIIPLSQWGGISYIREESSPGVIKADSGAALLGWIDLTGKKPLARNTTNTAKLLGNVPLTLTQQISQTIRFDSLFFPPAGPFILTCRDSTTADPAGYISLRVVPKVVICKEVQSPPCDINLPVTDVNTPSLPQKFELQQNMPNPFNPNTVINCAVPRPSQLKVEIFNVLGQKVKTLADEFCKAGFKRLEWDGTDQNGTAVASGVYMYRMTAGDFSETKKMLLLK